MKRGNCSKRRINGIRLIQDDTFLSVNTSFRYRRGCAATGFDGDAGADRGGVPHRLVAARRVFLMG